MDKILNLCKKIGIINFGDLQRFKQENMQKGESLITALERYLIEIGGGV